MNTVNKAKHNRVIRAYAINATIDRVDAINGANRREYLLGNTGFYPLDSVNAEVINLTIED